MHGVGMVNRGYDGKMTDHVGNFTFVLKLVSESFHIQKCNLRPTSFPVAYFELWRKQSIAMTP